MKNLKTQTRLFLLSLLAMTIGISSCKKDEKAPPADDGIEGTWELVSFTYDGYFEGFETSTPVTGTAKDINNVRVTFNSDGTVTGNGTSFTLVITGKENPDEKLEIPSEMLEEAGVWEKDGDMLYVTSFLENERMGVPITLLNATTLRLSGNVGGDEENEAIQTVDIRFARSN